jgi:putative thioredoxin
MVTFDHDVVDASRRQPVVVDLYADWCGPCRMLGPVLDQAVRDADGPVKLVKIDTDRQPELAEFLQVRGIPDVRLFVGGRQVASFTGYRPLPEVERFLAEGTARSHATR